MGRLGKDNNPFAIGVLLLGLAGCAGGVHGGRYAGPVDAQEGVCGPVSGGVHLTGTLLIRGEEAIFAPDSGVLVLRGRVDDAGHVSASSTAPGADHKPFPMVFEGDVHGGTVDGRYATPRCRAAVKLQRAD